MTGLMFKKDFYYIFERYKLFIYEVLIYLVLDDTSFREF